MKKVIGIDEAGRGPLAGPIVGASIFYRATKDQKKILAIAKDSKLISPKAREESYRLFTENFDYAIAAIDANYIDVEGLQRANVMVLVRAWKKLLAKIQSDGADVKSDYVGNFNFYYPCSWHFYKKGESKYQAIAAASILAKVYRDHLMSAYDEQYPQYNFAKHKGYGTPEHYQRLKKYGPSPIHRLSFLK